MKLNCKFVRILVIVMAFSMSSVTVFAAPSASSVGAKVNGFKTSYIVIDMNDKNIHPVMLTANNNLCSADSVSNMAKNNSCFAAINGTYFSAYNGMSISWGTIIKKGKVLHISNGGAVAGFTSDGKLVIDRLSFNFKGYINGEHRSIPWRINHPSEELDSITIFTPEYGTVIKMAEGAKAPVIEKGKVSYIATSDFYVPAGGFAIVYNPQVANLVDERFKVSDEVSYEVEISTTFTKQSTWNNVIQAVGAGPSLIINGQVTADGQAEQFFENKIIGGRAARTFIGSGLDGKVKIGTISSSTIKEAAEVCQNLGLINAMCLDGGGSIALYHNGKNITSGRNVNNAMGFVYSNSVKLVKSKITKVQVNGNETNFEAYNISGNNYFKLRDLAMAVNDTNKNFDVSWDNEKKAINLLSKNTYTIIGGELALGDGTAKTISNTSAKIYVDGESKTLTAYNIGGYNYFKLRDVAELFNIKVDYVNNIKTIMINTK